MKKLHLLMALVLTGLFFTSCKKQYSCQCTTTIHSPGYSPYTVSSVTKINSKTTKKRAAQICAHSEKQLNENTENYTNPTESLTTSCAYK